MEIFEGEVNDTEVDTCLVCLETIERSASVWSCSQCHDMTHLGCVQAWIAKANPRTTLSKEHFPLAHGWTCPKCRAPFMDVPQKYLCFCGKEDLSRNEVEDKYVAPHSCGEICGKRLSECSHTCAIPCHRSACPQCTRQQMAPCWCGRHRAMVRCGRTAYSCGERCGRPRPCGHACESSCHEGPECPPCPLKSTRSCKCGKTAPALLDCKLGTVDCGSECGQLLHCGFHRCAQKCHVAPCQPCPLMGRRSCPCGKTQYALKCDAKPPPKCNNPCNKRVAACGHVCQALCHDGPCDCSLAVTKMCRCGATKKQGVPCGAEIACNNRCANDRSCGKHKCRKKCCAGDCGPCTETCGGKLSCGNHRCEAYCHAGVCQKCPRKCAIPCACGMTVLRVDCGRETLVAPPKCKFVCSYQVCHHKPSHTCHFGPCPPCGSACGKAATPCGHADPRPCHDPPYALVPQPPVFKAGEVFKTKKEQNQENEIVKARGPRVRLALEAVQCAPCPVMVQRKCVGLHKDFSVVCSSDPVFACEAKCGVQLKCTHHTCQRKCHTVDETNPCKQCEERCAFNYRLCAHQCPLPCHPASVAHPPCPVPSPVTCHCGRTTTVLKCFEMSNQELVDRVRACAAPCPKDRPCGFHRCSKTCHDVDGDPCDSTCTKLMAVTCPCRERKGVRLPCDEVVALRKAKQLARESPAVLACDETCVAKREADAAARKKLDEEDERARAERRRVGGGGKTRQTPAQLAAAQEAARRAEAAALAAAAASGPAAFQERVLRIALACIGALLAFFVYRVLSRP